MGLAKWRNNNQLRLAQMLAEQAAKQRAAEMNQRFLEALRKALLGLDPGDPDVAVFEIPAVERDYASVVVLYVESRVWNRLEHVA